MSWKDIVKNEEDSFYRRLADEEVEDFLDDLNYKIESASDELRSTIFEFEYKTSTVGNLDDRAKEMIKEMLEGPEIKSALRKVFDAVKALREASELVVRLQ